MNNTSKITVANLSKNFANKQVLTDISFSINQGESLVILGGSGSGKSVLIKTIAGLVKPSGGEIFIDQKPTHNLTQKNQDQLMQKIGFLFQGGALFDSLLVWENVAFRLIHQQKISAKQAFDVAMQKLKSVGLNEKVANLYPSELSGGMQKRVSLARAIATNPQIIFFDEPTTGLDPIMADVINNLIIANSKELGATTLTITHDMHSARKIADKVAMLYQGRFIWFGSVDNLYNSGNEFVEQFIHGNAVGPINFTQ